MLIGGIAVLVLGALLLWGSASAQKRVRALRSAEQRTVAALEKLRQELTTEVGAGALREVCALEGTVECARPLRAEISGQDCVYYAARVERQYEETRQEGAQTTTSRGSETVASNTQRVEFELRDATGAVRVVPADAQIDARKVVERFEPAGLQLGPLTFGALSFTAGAAPGSQRTLGYKIVEHVVALGDPLYVLGEARDQDGHVVIARPRDRDAKFIVSARSKDELVRESAGQASWMKVVALVSLVGGTVLAVAGLIRR